MEKQPEIYVFTRAYNAEKTIRRTIESVLSQSYTNIKYVIRDNGSTDGTNAICREYAQRDSRIALVRNETNNTFLTDEDFAARQMERDVRYGAALGENDFFCLLDADDEYLPGFFERAVAFAEQEKLDIVVCGTEMVREETGEACADRSFNQKWILEGQGFSDFFPQYHWYMRAVWGKLYRRPVLLGLLEYWGDLMEKKVGNPKAALPYGADTLTAQYHFQRASRVGFLSGPCHRYYIQEKSVSSTVQPYRLESDQILHDATEAFLLQKCGGISAENRAFLQAVDACAILDTLRVIAAAKQTPEERLALLEKLSAQEVARQALRSGSREALQAKETLLKIALMCAERYAEAQEAEAPLSAVAQAVSPRCACAVTAASASLFLKDRALFETLLRDDVLRFPALLRAAGLPVPELLALAEQVRAILSRYPSDDPQVAELKASPVYRQIAWLIEE